MTNDFQIVFHNIDQSTAISDAVNKRISKLYVFVTGSCRPSGSGFSPQ